MGAIGLGGGHGDLGACPGVEHIIRLPGDGRAHHIHNGQDVRPPLLGLPQGGHGVQGLAGLADGNDQVALALQWDHCSGTRRPAPPPPAAPEHPLQVILAHHAHMVRRAAGNDDNAARCCEFPPRSWSDPAKSTRPSLEPGSGGLPDRPGLLKDLLEHEVGIAALFGGADVPVHMVMLLGHGLAPVRYTR